VTERKHRLHQVGVIESIAKECALRVRGDTTILVSFTNVSRQTLQNQNQQANELNWNQDQNEKKKMSGLQTGN
jgi:hypothetical protein